MLDKQSQTPQHDQPNWYGQASFIPGEQVDFRKSDLESIDLIQARQAIAAAIHTAPSGSLEVMQPEIETPQFQMRRIGKLLCKMRKMYDDETFNLLQDEDAPTAMFDEQKLEATHVAKSDFTSTVEAPNPITASALKGDFGLTGDVARPDVSNASKDDFGPAA